MRGRQQIIETAVAEEFDVLVIGGGITGSGVLRDACLRGLRCLLLEKGDFASGTSSRSGKLIHGGLRYLKYLHFRLVFGSCLERRRLLKTVAPHLVKPIRFTLPCYRHSRTPLWLTAIGLFLYDLLALFLNVGRFRFVKKSELKKRFPNLELRDLVGALSYYDCSCLDMRLVIDTIKSATQSGGLALNYCEVLKIEKQKDFFILNGWDHIGKRPLTLRTKALVNAAGSWADDVLARSPVQQRFGLFLTRGIHLTIDGQRFPLTETITLEAVQDGRNLYAVPWENRVLIGTTDNVYSGDKDDVAVPEDAVDYLFATMNQYFPELELTPKDVLSSYVGIRPLIGSHAGLKEEKIPRDYQIITSPEGMVSITGGKLTTYRTMAKHTVDAVVKAFFQKRTLRKQTTLSPISGGESYSMPGSTSPETLKLGQALSSRYGSNALKILNIVAEKAELARPVVASMPYVWAEIEYMLREEHVERVADVIFRRTPAFMLEGPASLRLAEAIAPYIGKQKGWDETRLKEEIDICEVEMQRNSIKLSSR